MQRQFLSLRDRASEIKRLVASPEVIPVAVAVDRSAKSRRPPKVGGPIPRPFSETSPGPRLWRGPRQRAARRQRQKERRKGLAPLVHSKRPETGRELQTATPRQRSASDYRPPRPFTELAATLDRQGFTKLGSQCREKRSMCLVNGAARFDAVGAIQQMAT